MSPTPPRGTRSGCTFNDLRNLAKRQGRDAAEYLSLFVLEGFLARLSASQIAFLLPANYLFSHRF